MAWVASQDKSCNTALLYSQLQSPGSSKIHFPHLSYYSCNPFALECFFYYPGDLPFILEIDKNDLAGIDTKGRKCRRDNCPGRTDPYSGCPITHKRRQNSGNKTSRRRKVFPFGVDEFMHSTQRKGIVRKSRF